MARKLSTALLAAFIAAFAGACSPTAESILIDPDEVSSDLGTLISIADIRSTCEHMVNSLGSDPEIAALRRTEKPLTVLVGPIRQFTTITNFDKQLFRNRLVSNLTRSDKDKSFRFIDRAPVAAERQRIASGQVKAAEPMSGLTGAQYVLTGEVRELFRRSKTESGGEEQRRSVQYTLTMTRVSDGVTVWGDTTEIVKKQLIGVAYQ